MNNFPLAEYVSTIQGQRRADEAAAGPSWAEVLGKVVESVPIALATKYAKNKELERAKAVKTEERTYQAGEVNRKAKLDLVANMFKDNEAYTMGPDGKEQPFTAFQYMNLFDTLTGAKSANTMVKKDESGNIVIADKQDPTQQIFLKPKTVMNTYFDPNTGSVKTVGTQKGGRLTVAPRPVNEKDDTTAINKAALEAIQKNIPLGLSDQETQKYIKDNIGFYVDMLRGQKQSSIAPQGVAAPENSRQKAIDFLTLNKAPITDANIAAVIKNKGF